MKGVKFDFIIEYNDILYAYGIIGKSANRKKILKLDIQNILNDIQIFINEIPDKTDIDVVFAIDIYNKLETIENQL